MSLEHVPERDTCRLATSPLALEGVPATAIEAKIAYPTNAILDKDAGLQGYEPDRGLTAQPKKSLRSVR